MLLKEIYITANGLNLFTYPQNLVEDKFVKSNLTSGFLSAIQAFSMEARESEIEYFESRDEYFLFTPLKTKNRMLICVFDKNDQRDLADNLLKKVLGLMLDSHLILEDYDNVIDNTRNKELCDNIDKLLEDAKNQSDPAKYAQGVFNGETAISSLRVLDLINKQTLFEDARPKPFLKTNQINEIYLTLDAFDKISERSKLPIFDFLSIYCQGAFFVIFRTKSNLSMITATGIANPETIQQKVLDLYNYGNLKSFKAVYQQNINNPSYSISLNNDGEIISEEGTSPAPLMDVFLLTTLNALSRLVSSFVRKNYDRVEIFIPSKNRTTITMEVKNSQHTINFNTNE